MEEYARHYDDKTVAVTGGSGYLASALIQVLQGTTARVLSVSRQHLAPAPGSERFKADVRTKECWREIVERADIIFHLAGNTSVYDAARDPAESLQSTVLPLIHLTAAAREAGRHPRVVYASTATVYGLTDKLPVGEDAEARPATTYDLHKLCAERHLELASNQGVLDGVSLRLANVYGPSPGTSSADERGVLNRVTKRAVQGLDLCLYGDGDYVRDYVYIGDVIRAFLMAGAQPGVSGAVFNVASGTGITVRDAFHAVTRLSERVSGRRSLVHNAAWPDTADPIERRSFIGNVDRMASVCGWRPAVSLTDGLEHLIDHFANTEAHR